MACTLTQGTTLNDCNETVGGIKAIYIANHVDVYPNGTFTGSALTASSDTITFQTFEVHPEKSSLTVRINSSPENGTTFYDQELSIVVRDLNDSTNQDALEELTKASTLVAVELYTGERLVIGGEHGCDASGGQVETGRGFGDMQGITLNLRGRETKNMLLNVASGDWPSGWTLA